MSADLFAQFGPSSNQQSQQNQKNEQQTQPPADDPFGFLSAAWDQPTAQPPPQPPQPQWTQSSSPLQTWPVFNAPAASSQTTATSWGGGTWSGAMPSTTAAAAGDDDDDAWGDFEEASPGTTAPVRPQPTAAPPAYSAPLQTAPTSSSSQRPAGPRLVRASTMDLMTNTLVSFDDGLSAAAATPPIPRVPDARFRPRPQPTQRTAQTRSPPTSKKPSDPSVLFDAEDYDAYGSVGDGDDDDDDDEFGDFETGQPAPPPPPPSAVTSRMPPRLWEPPKPAAGPTAATALVDLLSLADPEPPTGGSASWTIAPPSSPSTLQLRGLTKQPPPTPSQPASPNLLSPLSFGSTSLPATAATRDQSQPPKSPSFQARNPFPGLTVTTPQSAEFPKERIRSRTPSPVTSWPSFGLAASTAPAAPGTQGSTLQPRSTDDDWTAWDDVDAGPSQPAATPRKSVQSESIPKQETTADDWGWDAEEPSQAADKAIQPAGIANATAPKILPDHAPPPTNVPPPSILLSLFPTLIALPDEALFKPTATQPAEVRTRILGAAKTIAFLRNYLQIMVVAARVIAGRKQRWHRDKFLSQSMSISAAGSSRGGGMKLAGIDKAQGQREDREAADVVAVWLRHVGKLRSAVATANAALVAAEAADHRHYAPLRIPELQSATIPVTAVKNVPTAPRPCVVCGLRRDERIRGVDGDDVQDSFGEWWVEHWGHRSCRNFWAEHEAALRTR